MSKYLVIALAAILLANGWWQNKKHPRPAGVIAVTLYFLVVALPTFESLNTILMLYSIVNLYGAAGVWFMRSDGRQSAIFLSWVNIGIVALIAILIFGSAHFAHERVRLGVIGLTLVAAFLSAFVYMPIAILRYLKYPRVASLFSTDGLVRKDVAKA